MQVTVQLDRASAANTVERQRILSESGAAGVSLRPLHPGTRDADLARYYVGDVADDAQIQKLRAIAGVEAAYVKPADELP